MKKLKCALAIMTLCGVCYGQKNEDFVRSAPGEVNFGKTPVEAYTPEIRGNMRRLYHDKIGLFVHFGPYAQLEGIWNGKQVAAEWIMNKAAIPIVDYEREAAGKFNPSRFKADEWVKVAKGAGMGFIVVTSKHHDGFAMFKSKNPYNLVDFTKFKRDLIGELSVACKKGDIGFGVYYSQSQDWHEEGAAGNTWDFPKIQPQEKFDAYFDRKVVPQVTELATQYRDLFMFWFDTPSRMKDSQCVLLMDIIKKNQPAALVNSRLGNGYGHFNVSLDGGQTPNVNKVDWLPDLKVPWQTHTSVAGSWGYTKWAANRDRSADYSSFIYNLCNIVSHGGVELLNVAPAPDGTIPLAQVESLVAIGDWLKVNGEAIYDADPSPFIFPPFAITSKPGKLYLHLESDATEQIKLEGLLSKVQKVYCLADADKQALKFNQKNGELTFQLPRHLMQPHVTVVVLEIDEKTARVADETIVPKSDGTIDLPVAKCTYAILRIGYNYDTQETRRWGENKSQGLIWTVRIDKPFGKYKLISEQTGDSTLQYKVSVLDQVLLVDAKGSKDMSRKEASGVITFNKPGTYTITANPEITIRNTDYEFKGLTLVPIR
jgi:alpha-L-fucosidase